MRYGTVCSGIGAPETAWQSLGWDCGFMSEIEPFPRAALEHHYPDVPLHGDFTTIGEKDYGPVDLICGGTPCQAFSIAGLRGGFDDERGNLTLEFVRLVERKKPRWVLWENVPGVLSMDGGRAFGSFLGGLAQCGYGFAYRVLDAQYFGVPQRRRRVFVVGHLGSWQRAAAVLFESDSLRGDITPSREKGEAVAANAGEGIKNGSHWDGEENPHPALSQSHNTGGIGQSNQEIFAQRGAGLTYGIPGNHVGRKPENGGNGTMIREETCPTLTSIDRHAVARMTAIGEYTEDNTAGAIKARDYKDATDLVYSFPADMSGTQRGVQKDRTGALRTGGQAAVMYENHMQDSRVKEVEVAPSLSAKAGTGGGNLPLVQEIYPINTQVGLRNHKDGDGTGLGIGGNGDPAYTLQSAHSHAVSQNMTVRRLTPRECERLQGFPDDYTAIAWRGKEPHQCPDGPRYKALGNSMAVPVLRWIGERIQMIDDMVDA